MHFGLSLQPHFEAIVVRLIVRHLNQTLQVVEKKLEFGHVCPVP